MKQKSSSSFSLSDYKTYDTDTDIDTSLINQYWPPDISGGF